MNIFHRREHIAPELAAALEQLDKLAQSLPALRGAAALQSAILRAIYRESPSAGTLDIPPERAAEKLRNGTPLLRGEVIPLDLPATERLLLRLCQVAREYADAPEAARAIETALRRHDLDASTLVGQVLQGQIGAVREQAAGRDLDGELLCTLLRFSMLPALEQLTLQLAPLRAATRWEQGYCPHCGNWPLLGEFRGLEQSRVLRCGLCAAEWAIDRMLCPFCGNRDHNDLGYLYAEGNEQKRTATCERCGCYVKMLATLTAIPPAELAVEDLTTLHLDVIALDRGYAQPG
jgi:FdhE protein